MWTPKDVTELVGQLVPVVLALVAYAKARTTSEVAEKALSQSNTAHNRIDQAKEDIRSTNQQLQTLSMVSVPSEVVAAAIRTTASEVNPNVVT